MAGAGESRVLAIEKLTGMSDYNSWAYAMQRYLINEDLWDYVTRNTAASENYSTEIEKKNLSQKQAELQSLQEYGAWSVVEKPEKTKVIPCKWGFKLKMGIDGVPDRYKARLIAKGFAQTYGENYDETFAPVVRKETIRMLFGFAAV
jgi:hypothetical protein